MNYDNPYLLMTPGPLSTSATVRMAARFDSCTWDNDYKTVVEEIRQELLSVAGCDPNHYTVVLMQGSGTFGVESTLGSCINLNKHKILFCVNGVYGRRMVEIARVLKLPHSVCEIEENHAFDPAVVETILKQQSNITHVAIVHCETTTGLLNNLNPIAQLTKAYKKYFVVDAMSSFAGISLNSTELGIDFLVSSANKCIQGIPGFSFVICKQSSLESLCKGNQKSHSLDLYGQWHAMQKDPGKWRFTSPTHSVLAFSQALKELSEETVMGREARYKENQKALVKGMEAVGYQCYIPHQLQSSIITSFIAPRFIPGTKKPFFFDSFYSYLKKNGFVIYPGKVTDKDTFRIGTIGHLFPTHITQFLEHVRGYSLEANAQQSSLCYDLKPC